MNKLIFCLLMLMGMRGQDSLAAQHPQYYCGPAIFAPFPLWARYRFAFNYGYPGDTVSIRMQMIYKPKFFAGSKAGQITNVYFRAYDNPPKGTLTIYPHYEIRLGYTQKAGYLPVHSNAIDTFLETTSVFSADNYTVQGSDSVYGWVKIPLNKSSFLYDPSRNLVLEVRSGPTSPQHPFSYISSALRDTGNATYIYGYSSNPYSNAGGMVESVIDFGFDIMGAGAVGGPGASQAEKISAYPNPAAGKLFLRTTDVQQVSIYDLQGRCVIPPAIYSSVKGIDIHALSTGIYLLHAAYKEGSETFQFIKE